MKPMVFVCMLLAGEVFVWLQLGKQNAVDSNSKAADMELTGAIRKRKQGQSIRENKSGESGGNADAVRAGDGCFRY